ncbi:MAG: CPBP family intramembrane metalloprotease [Verrucomicrobia bacterium]|nr:CPBP family intramembrane metalloprotease [Verrucomicrobiota bacterium]
MGAIAACFGALAEEVGWRGFLFPALASRFGFATLTWLIWTISFLFQAPNILFAHNHAPAPVGLLALGALIFATTVILNWLRLGSGSVWPPALFHITHSFLVAAVFNWLIR